MRWTDWGEIAQRRSVCSVNEDPIPIPGAHINAVWVWEFVCDSSLGKWRGEPQGKPNIFSKTKGLGRAVHNSSIAVLKICVSWKVSGVLPAACPLHTIRRKEMLVARPSLLF